MKTYLKDLTLDEVVNRLQAGQVAKCDNVPIKFKIIGGMLCGLWDNREIEYNATLLISHDSTFYFDEELLQPKEEVFHPQKEMPLTGENVSITASKEKWMHLLDLIHIAATSQENGFLTDRLQYLSIEIIGKNLGGINVAED